ncbi:hypothetical protein FIBSPDRAFT_901419 [Athelia psychrophila]|uniref:CxC2-like cysteine cluster KDZ transposase-associated domain-containing protein n=1 Tax=Athelia psychrophila TaxID=1759441 RepID=A0A165X5L6_9AGAM|nr:hypothetical protein FIBSPDRAFT_901419 [Fibularhizoctonia sp. CBS 109695]
MEPSSDVRGERIWSSLPQSVLVPAMFDSICQSSYCNGRYCDGERVEQVWVDLRSSYTPSSNGVVPLTLGSSDQEEVLPVVTAQPPSMPVLQLLYFDLSVIMFHLCVTFNNVFLFCLASWVASNPCVAHAKLLLSRSASRYWLPSDLEDNFAHWDPGEGGAYSDDEGYNGPSTVVTDLELLLTCMRYLSLDYPMLAWRQGHITEFLHEMLHHDSLEEWTGEFWQKKTLRDLSLVFQLGHADNTCHHPENSFKLTVLNSHGIHEVTAHYCRYPNTCTMFHALEEFNLLNLKGALNVHNWITTLAMRMNGTKVSLTPDREKMMLRVFHQLQSQVKQQSCIGMWMKNSNSSYVLILAMDTNFQLTNQMCANEHDDAELGPGWGCTVDSTPYKEHLKNYVSEADIVGTDNDMYHIHGPSAEGLEDDHRAADFRSRPCGVGDLQKGKRYANMDHIFFSSIMSVALLYFTISYDIVCQWKINIATRNKLLLQDIQQGQADWPPLHHHLVPVSHRQLDSNLRREFLIALFKYLTSLLQDNGRRGAALGNMQVTGELVALARNFRECCRLFSDMPLMLGDSLARKLIIAKEERNVQFPDATQQWVDEVTAWEMEHKLPVKDQIAPNPYEILKNGGVTEAQVRLKLRQEETAEVHEGQGALHETSTMGFLAMGLHIEKAQISVDAASSLQPTANQASLLEEHHLQIWWKLPDLYTHASAFVITKDEEHRLNGLPQPLVEDVSLWMPSTLPANAQQTGCVTNLPAMELMLQVAQCYKALDTIRSNLHTKKHIINCRNKNVTSQKKFTRLCTLIGQLGDQVTVQFKKYIDEQQVDHKASRRMNHAGGGRPRLSKKQVTVTPAVCREYLKARAQKHRWVEEVALLTEEMWPIGGGHGIQIGKGGKLREHFEELLCCWQAESLPCKAGGSHTTLWQEPSFLPTIIMVTACVVFGKWLQLGVDRQAKDYSNGRGRTKTIVGGGGGGEVTAVEDSDVAFKFGEI